MKKNTLLYLDDNLVKRAKRMGFNISKLSEDSIKQKLGIQKEFEPKEYLQELMLHELIYFLPFKIKSIEILNIKNIKHFQVELKEINFILGKNASGKTNLIKSIIYPFHKSASDEEILFSGSKKGSIKISPINKLENIELKVYEEDSEILQNYKCILIDSGLRLLKDRETTKMLNYLIERDLQIIMTCKILPNFKNKGVNVINLPK